MRMLNEADENDVEVSWADQQQINAFSRYNLRLQEVTIDLKEKQDEKEAIEDLSTEVELMDEEEMVLYKLGSTFMHIPQPNAVELIEKDSAALDEEIKSLSGIAGECNEQMEKLKVELYAKFGNNINLERD